MKRAKMILTKLLHPPKWILISAPGVVFAALIFIFAAGERKSRHYNIRSAKRRKKAEYLE